MLKRNSTNRNRREHLFVVGGLSVSFILIIIFIFFLFNAFQDRNYLRLQMQAEQAFNSVYFNSEDTPQRVLAELEKDGIYGLGIYSNSGYQKWAFGDVPKVVEANLLDDYDEWSQSIDGGVPYFHPNDNIIEYVRLLNNISVNDNIAAGNDVSVGKLTLTDFSLPKLVFPDVLYIVLDGSEYNAQKRTYHLAEIAVLIAISLVFYLIIRMYFSNRKNTLKLESQKSLVSLGQAARTLTHEIKNPLSAINIQLAILRVKVNPSYKSNLEVIQSEVDRLNGLTARVSEFLLNPTGNPKEFELVNFIQGIATKFPNKISIQSISQFYVNMDQLRARSVFENLIKNAVESGDNPQVEVIIKKGTNIKTVVVEVLDRGDGLPKGVKDKIYDPFFTTKTKGSGIGLSISRQFVSARGGNLSLSPRDGGGTVARVVLPTVIKIGESFESINSR